jgi:hypothetical protein
MTSTPPAIPPTEPKPEGAKEKKKRKFELDPGLALVIATSITVAAGGCGALIAHLTASSGSPIPAASTASSAPASVSIDSPVSGTIERESTYTGSIRNFHPGDSVWVFFQSVDKEGNINPETYPTSGPCVVDFAKNTWNCDEVFVGKITDSATYRVCAAILNFSESHAVVKLLEIAAANVKGSASWFESPPSYINSQSCISVPRVN